MTRTEQVHLTFTDAGAGTLPPALTDRAPLPTRGEGPVLVPVACPKCPARAAIIDGTTASHGGKHDRVTMVREEPTR